jgi:hypothetical protein
VQVKGEAGAGDEPGGVLAGEADQAGGLGDGEPDGADAGRAGLYMMYYSLGSAVMRAHGEELRNGSD